jgi:hypothetical protein
MTANVFQDHREQVVDISYNSPRKLEWIVKEDPQLQAELNGLNKAGKKLSPKVVNKVVARIKDL